MTEQEALNHLRAVLANPKHALSRGATHGTYFETIDGRWWGYERLGNDWVLFSSQGTHSRLGTFDSLTTARIRALKESRNA